MARRAMRAVARAWSRPPAPPPIGLPLTPDTRGKQMDRSARIDARNTFFHPADAEEHERGNAGEEVPDYCIHCRQPFEAHNNGKCPS